MIRKFTGPKLTEHLKNYWLVTDKSPMMEIVKRAVGAYLEANRPVKVYFDDKPTVDIEPALKAIGLVAGKGYVISHSPDETRKRTDFHRVPPTGERTADFERLLPYYFEHTRRMHSNLPQAKALTVEVAFILWIEHLLLTGRNSLGEIIEEAFCSSASGKLIISESGNHEFYKSQWPQFLSLISSIDPLAATYAGFSKTGAWKTGVTSWLNLDSD